MTSRMPAARAAGLLLLAATALLATVPVSSQERRQGRRVRTVMVEGREAVDGEVLVRYRSVVGAFERARAESEAEADEVETIGRRGLRRMHSRRHGTKVLLAMLRANPDVEFAEPNFVLSVGRTPNDPSFGNLWGLWNIGQSGGAVGNDIGATQAWDVSTGSPSIVVGVVDTGIDYTHPDLAANIWSAPAAFTVTIGSLTITCPAGSHGFNAINNSCDPMDDNNHGTHVAGTIGAVGNNSIGVSGVNWRTSMMGLKFLSAGGSGFTSDAIKAIEFAIQARSAFAATSGANVRILSNSWGGGGFSNALLHEINRANDNDMLFVAAAGNDGKNNDAVPTYPANYASANIMSVAALDRFGQRAGFSNWGAATVHLGAPGVSILSTTRSNSYAWFNGTSMATPHVAGAAALLLSVCPLTTPQVKAALLNAVAPAASMSGTTTTGGRLDVNAAVRSCSAARMTVNGTSGPASVSAGGSLNVAVIDGPGYPGDFVMLVPQGAVSTHWSGIYQYLNGTTTRPGSGVANASLTFTAPSEPGAYEFRLFENDTWRRLATSSTVTVENVPPVLSSVAPTSIRGGLTLSPATVTLTGTGFTATSQVRVNGTGRVTTFVSPTSLTAVVTSAERAVASTLNFTVHNAPPGGGSSTGRNVMITAPPVVSVNSSITAVTAAANGVISVGISGGPANAGDFVMMVPAGAAPTYWSGNYQYLNGSTTRPASGSTSATLTFAAPASTGTYELRFFENDTWAMLNKSAAVTIVQPNPVPAIGALSPASVFRGGSAFVLTISGTGFTTSSQVRVNGVARATTYSAATGRLSVALTSQDIATAATIPIAVVTPSPGGGTSNTLNLAVVAPPSLSIGGSTSVIGGGLVPVVIANGPGNRGDFVMMVPVGAADTHWSGNYQYLNGSTTAPATGTSSATLTFVAPLSGGNHEFRLFANDTWTRLATSEPIQVTAWSPPRPAVTVNSSTGNVSVAGGSSLSIGITNGPGNRGDFVMLVPAGSPETYWSGIYQYLNGSTTAPATGSPSSTLTFTAPAGGGQFEVRFFANDTWSRLATSGTIAVTPYVAPTPQLRVNNLTGPVSWFGGGSVTVQVSAGPAKRGDFVMMVPAGAPDTYWSGNFKYLNDTTTLPASGSSSATLTFATPAGGGDFEFRFFENDAWKRLATSGAVTIFPAVGPPRVGAGNTFGPVTAAAGSPLSVHVVNGPATRGDFVMLVPVGSPDTYWSGRYLYLNDTTTAPATGTSSATLTFTAPSSGTWEVRFFRNDTWTRLATSAAVRITP